MLRVCTKYAKLMDESMACNAEPRIEHLMERLNQSTDGNAAAYVANAFASKKARYTALQWQDMATQRTAWLKKTRPRDFMPYKCCDVNDSACVASQVNLATTCAASQANLAKARFIEGARAHTAKFPTPLCTDSVAGTKLLLATTGSELVLLVKIVHDVVEVFIARRTDGDERIGGERGSHDYTLTLGRGSDPGWLTCSDWLTYDVTCKDRINERHHVDGSSDCVDRLARPSPQSTTPYPTTP